MEVPLSHCGWALQPKVQSDCGDSDDATSDEKGTPALVTPGEGGSSRLSKTQKYHHRCKVEAAARKRAAKDTYDELEVCEITPSLLLSRVQRLVEWDAGQLRPYTQPSWSLSNHCTTTTRPLHKLDHRRQPPSEHNSEDICPRTVCPSLCQKKGRIL